MLNARILSFIIALVVGLCQSSEAMIKMPSSLKKPTMQKVASVGQDKSILRSLLIANKKSGQEEKKHSSSQEQDSPKNKEQNSLESIADGTDFAKIDIKNLINIYNNLVSVNIIGFECIIINGFHQAMLNSDYQDLCGFINNNDELKKSLVNLMIAVISDAELKQSETQKSVNDNCEILVKHYTNSVAYYSNYLKQEIRDCYNQAVNAGNNDEKKEEPKFNNNNGVKNANKFGKLKELVMSFNKKLLFLMKNNIFQKLDFSLDSNSKLYTGVGIDALMELDQQLISNLINLFIKDKTLFDKAIDQFKNRNQLLRDVYNAFMHYLVAKLEDNKAAKGPEWEIKVAVWLDQYLKGTQSKDFLIRMNHHVTGWNEFSREFDLVTFDMLFECKNIKQNNMKQKLNETRAKQQFIEQSQIAHYKDKQFIVISLNILPIEWGKFFDKQHIDYIDPSNVKTKMINGINFTDLYNQ